MYSQKNIRKTKVLKRDALSMHANIIPKMHLSFLYIFLVFQKHKHRCRMSSYLVVVYPLVPILRSTIIVSVDVIEDTAASSDRRAA